MTLVIFILYVLYVVYVFTNIFIIDLDTVIGLI